MLAPAQRLGDAELFRRASRRGSRASRGALTAHLLDLDPASGQPARAGFVVSKAVGNSVVRHRVQRRLRHALRPRMRLLPAGAVLVVRASPAAATASYAALDADLGACLDRLGVGEEQR